MSLIPCASCHELVGDGLCVCPHCGGKACRSQRGVSGPAMALLGLTLVAGCGKNDDTGETGSTPTGSTAQALYGAPATGSTSRGPDEAAELAAELLQPKPAKPADDEDPR